MSLVGRVSTLECLEDKLIESRSMYYYYQELSVLVSEACVALRLLIVLVIDSSYNTCHLYSVEPRSSLWCSTHIHIQVVVVFHIIRSSG